MGSSGPDYASDGTTLVDVIGAFEAQGYTGQFRAAGGGTIQCLTCREIISAEQAKADHLRRTEGASDPDDMTAVLAITCCHCGALGTVTLHYGAEASPEEAEALAALDR